MDVITKAYIKHGGSWYKQGEEIKGVEVDAGNNLISRSLAYETEASVKASIEAEKAALKAAEDESKKEADDKAKADAAAKKKADEAAKASKQADKKGK